MITVIDSNRIASVIPEGSASYMLSPSISETRVEVSTYEVHASKALRIPASDRSQVVYILDGKDAEIAYTSEGKTTTHPAQKTCGVYLEPNEGAVIKASSTPVKLLHITVPKYTGKPISGQLRGYFFDESKLQVLVDERRIRTRTFWVNKETGLSGSWDLQAGRMLYEPHAHAPRHVHHAGKNSSVTPEHFYLITVGTGFVKHDEGSIPLGAGDLVLIPAGEWHQLHATDTGLDYIEFQGPFDFATTMDHDPLGKNWYIKGTDDGKGNLKLWVQS